jgi:hypothetical protein
MHRFNCVFSSAALNHGPGPRPQARNFVVCCCCEKFSFWMFNVFSSILLLKRLLNKKLFVSKTMFDYVVNRWNLFNIPIQQIRISSLFNSILLLLRSVQFTFSRQKSLTNVIILSGQMNNYHIAECDVNSLCLSEWSQLCEFLIAWIRKNVKERVQEISRPISFFVCGSQTQMLTLLLYWRDENKGLTSF